jgi:nucleoside-diphosphate-sugar epimerase
MSDVTVAVTGVSGFLAQRLLPLLDASPAVARVVGFDLTDPPRQARKLTFERLDVLTGDLDAALHGVDTIVHLAGIARPLLDEALLTRVNCDGTRRVIEAASRVGVRKIVKPASAAVYGAWANNPVPLTEDAPLRPNPGYLPAILDAECERLLAEWERERAGRIATRLRIAPIVGGDAQNVFALAATGRPPVVVRQATPQVQVVYVDDVASALLLAVERDLDGVFNVGADGWLSHDDAAALLPRRHMPGVPAEAAERMLAALWSSGLGDAPASVVPYLAQPWVIANDRLKDAGWKPTRSNEEAILLASPVPGTNPLPWVAAVAAVVLGAAGATWWLTRRRATRS